MEEKTGLFVSDCGVCLDAGGGEDMDRGNPAEIAPAVTVRGEPKGGAVVTEMFGS